MPRYQVRVEHLADDEYEIQADDEDEATALAQQNFERDHIIGSMGYYTFDVTALSKECANCEMEVETDWQFCPACGSAIS